MIRKNLIKATLIKATLIKATLITTVIATLLASSGCGKKAANNGETTVQPVTVSAETASNAAKELTKTGLVTFNYTDAAGNTYTLEGKAVASENGDATIEVTDVQGNKVTFTGKAKTIDGKLSVSDIAVKEAGTLVKADGSKIEISTDATVADASESTEGESNSDISVSDDVKQEIETAKKEESVIEAAREEVTKAESNVADNDNVAPEEPKNDISDMPAQPDTTPEKPNITPEEPKNDTQDRPAEPDVKPEEPKDDTPDTPNEPDVTPAQPDTTPEEPKEDTPEPPAEDNKDNNSSGGYDFPKVEGPNGPMYAYTGSNWWQVGQDVNQGADKECPYALKTITTRYFSRDAETFSMCTGYYYIAINEDGDEANTRFEELAYNMGKYNNTRREVGTYSCGLVCFCAFDD